MGADFVACDFCVLCSQSVKVVACQPTPQRVPGKEFARRERESFYTLSLSPYLLIVSVDLLETSKIEKKKKDVPAPPLFSVSHFSIYHHFEPSVSSIS